MPLPAINHTTFPLSTAAAGGTFDIEIAGFGQPDAVMFFVSGATVNDTRTANAVLGVGFTDGVNDFSGAAYSRNNVVTMDPSRAHGYTSCIYLAKDNLQSNGAFSFNSWTANGVRLNIDEQCDTAFLCTAVFFAGGIDYAETYETQFDGSTDPQAITLTGLGEPDLVIMWSNVDSANFNRVLTLQRNSFGMAINEATIPQFSASWGSSGHASANVTTYVSNNTINSDCLNGTLESAITLTDIRTGAGGAGVIEFTPSIALPNRRNGGLAIKFTDPINKALFSTTTPGAPGTYVETTPGFEPGFGFLYTGAGPNTYNLVLQNNTSSSAFSFLGSDSTDSVLYTDRNGTATAVAESQHTDTFKAVRHNPGITMFKGGPHTFTSVGWDIPLTEATTFNRLTWALALEAVGFPAPGDAITPANATQAQRAEAAALAQAHILAPDGATQAQRAEAAALELANVITPDGATQAQRAEAAALIQTHVLTPANATQAQRAEEAGLTQVQFIVPADAFQAQRAGEAGLTIGDMVTPDNATQAQIADEAGIVQFHIITPDNANQAQIADVVILGGFVIGNLGGELVAYTLVDGVLTVKSLYSGEIHTVH